jgi:hypothetical protein
MGAMAGAHPIIVITRRTSASTDKANFFMTFSPLILLRRIAPNGLR